MLNKGKLRRNKVRIVVLTYIFGPSSMCMILLKGTKLSALLTFLQVGTFYLVVASYLVCRSPNGPGGRDRDPRSLFQELGGTLLCYNGIESLRGR